MPAPTANDRKEETAACHGELLRLGLRIFGQLVALEADLVFEQLPLRPHRDELAGGHREGAGSEARHAGQHDDRRIRARAGDAENETRIRYEPVVDPENGGPQIAAATESPVPALDAAGDRRHVATRLALGVYRHAAHFHRRENGAQWRRAEELDQARDQSGAQIGYK